jgi:hypothetical protein
MVAGNNPYSAPLARGDGSAPNPSGEMIWGGPGRYAVRDIPESTDPEYTTGFSPELAATGSPDGTKLPDDIRVGTRNPPPNDPNTREVNDRRYSEFHFRHSVEQTDVGWKVRQQKVPGGQNPLWYQERVPIRPTADASPTGYQFRRPWHIPRNIKDAVGEDAVAHFSMADHRRAYEIYGQKPQGGMGTNTYRSPVRPWDETLFIPPQAADTANGIVGNRAHRLGT